MKRASLSVVPQTKQTATPDLADRLLEREAAAAGRGNPSARSRPRKRAAPRPKALSTKTRTQSSADADAPRAPSAEAIRDALSQSRAAVEALRQAADAGPARYSVALRYRLDALAHHLTQINQVIESLLRQEEAGRR